MFSNYGQTWPNRVYIHKHKHKHVFFKFARIEDFLEKGTSTAMKKVVKFLQGTIGSATASQKRKSISVQDPKQRSILSFLKKKKNEI